MFINNPTHSQFEKFFTVCGEFLSSTTQVIGLAPNRSFVQKFFYTKGQAEFDGKQWKLQWN